MAAVVSERCYPEEWFEQNAAHIRLVETERDWLRRDYDVVKRERDQALERERALRDALAEAIAELGGSIIIEPRMDRDKRTWVMTGPERIAASGLAYRYRVVWTAPVTADGEGVAT